MNNDSLISEFELEALLEFLFNYTKWMLADTQ